MRPQRVAWRLAWGYKKKPHCAGWDQAIVFWYLLRVCPALAATCVKALALAGAPVPGHPLRYLGALLLQLLVRLHVRQACALRHGLAHKGLIRPAAGEGHLYQCPFERKREHARIIPGHWLGQQHGRINRRTAVGPAVCVKQLHIDGITWQEWTSKLITAGRFTHGHPPRKFW